MRWCEEPRLVTGCSLPLTIVAFSLNTFPICIMGKLKQLCSSPSDILEPLRGLQGGKSGGKLLSTHQKSLLEITHLPELSLRKSSTQPHQISDVFIISYRLPPTFLKPGEKNCIFINVDFLIAKNFIKLRVPEDKS